MLAAVRVPVHPQTWLLPSAAASDYPLASVLNPAFTSPSYQVFRLCFRLIPMTPLRILTSSNSASECGLFPGHKALFVHDTKTHSSDSSDDEDADCSSESVDVDAGRIVEAEAHGLLRLLVLSNDSISSMRTLRDGLAAVSSGYSSACLPFQPHHFRCQALVACSLYELVGDTCLNSGKARRELRS